MVTDDGQDGDRGAASVEVTAGRSAAEARPRGRRRAASKATVAVGAGGLAEDVSGGTPGGDEAGEEAPSPPAVALTEPSAELRCALPNDLRAVPLFASLSDANLASLARSVHKRRASAGEVL